MERNDNDTFWHAVLSRDARFDGRFVFAVHHHEDLLSSIVPGRAARAAIALHFFALPEAATQPGFAPVSVCLPQQASLLDPQVVMVQRVCRLIETSLDETPSLEALSAEVGLSLFSSANAPSRM
jgi:AraC family transcriptional regulator of adaptative response/methylated-DNA-[protein]-cysteine methyltransferase